MHKIFKSLGDETRLKLFLIINEAADVCLCDLEICFSLSESNLSRHLKELQQSNLLDVKKIGKWKYYAVSEFGVQFIQLILRILDTKMVDEIKTLAKKIERSTRC